jgi:hypothetical protein
LNYLRAIPTAWPPIQLLYPPPADRYGFLKILESGDVNLVHFATHGLPQSDGVGIAMIQLRQSELAVDDLVGGRSLRDCDGELHSSL